MTECSHSSAHHTYHIQRHLMRNVLFCLVCISHKSHVLSLSHPPIFSCLSASLFVSHFHFLSTYLTSPPLSFCISLSLLLLLILSLSLLSLLTPFIHPPYFHHPLPLPISLSHSHSHSHTLSHSLSLAHIYSPPPLPR